MLKDPETLAALLLRDVVFSTHKLVLCIGGCTLRIRSNSQQLLDKLKKYYAHVICDAGSTALDISVIETAPVLLPCEFVDWPREVGKSGRKEAYYELCGGRLVRKVRTEMLFLQSEAHRIAIGPCLLYDNQVINFINSQYMTWLQHKGWHICHAAGVAHAGKILAIAGFSGGGKSTLMLKLLEDARLSYLTNDRLLIRRQGTFVQAAGIPKLPRVNPGTLVNNARLTPMLSEQAKAKFLALSTAQLWELEEKYDVDIAAFYGNGRIVEQAVLSGFLVLNWHRSSTQDFNLRQVNLKQRKESLGVIMKSPGPFYQYPDGSFLTDSEIPDAQAYLNELAGVPVYEVTGRVDFGGLAARCNQLIFSELAL